MAVAGNSHAQESQRPLLTQEGRNKLEERLRHLVEVLRPQIAEDIHEAKEAGDVSESSAYEHAKNEQARIEGEIMELTALLNNSGTLEFTSGAQRVQIGTRIRVKRLDTSTEREFTIVSTHEADPKRNFISTESPVGNALLNKEVGAEVDVPTPNGVVKYKVLEIL